MDIAKLQYEMDLDDIEELINSYGKNSSGKITLEVFKLIMREDKKLKHCKRGIASILTKKLSTELSN